MPENGSAAKEHAGRVREMFASMARRYDLLHNLLSGNVDKRWRRIVATRVREKLSTGESARGRKPTFLYVDSRKRCVLAVDIRPTRTSVMVTDLLGQPIVVDNKAGAGGRIALEQLRTSAADGTVMAITPHPMVTRRSHDAASSGVSRRGHLAGPFLQRMATGTFPVPERGGRRAAGPAGGRSRAGAPQQPVRGRCGLPGAVGDDALRRGGDQRACRRGREPGVLRSASPGPPRDGLRGIGEGSGARRRGIARRRARVIGAVNLRIRIQAHAPRTGARQPDVVGGEAARAEVGQHHHVLVAVEDVVGEGLEGLLDQRPRRLVLAVEEAGVDILHACGGNARDHGESRGAA